MIRCVELVDFGLFLVDFGLFWVDSDKIVGMVDFVNLVRFC